MSPLATVNRHHASDHSMSAATACSMAKGVWASAAVPVQGTPNAASSTCTPDAAVDEPSILGHDAEHDSRKPIYHVMPLSGWSSDPCGAIHYKGKYHLFYQHRPETCQWYWGVGWDHVYSPDLVTWCRLPPALTPTPGWWDTDGCFTGSVQVHPVTQEPVLLYTGACLQCNPATSTLPLPPDHQNMGLPHLETQLYAKCHPGDALLQQWTKCVTPWLLHPPSSQLSAWRDPWFLDADTQQGPGAAAAGSRENPLAAAAGSQQGPGTGAAGRREGRGGAGAAAEGVPRWRMLLGSGVKGKGGCVLLYGSNELTDGWQLEGELCSWPDHSLGANWEVPFLVQPRQLPAPLQPSMSTTPSLATGLATYPATALATSNAAAPASATEPMPAGGVPLGAAGPVAAAIWGVARAFTAACEGSGAAGVGAVTAACEGGDGASNSVPLAAVNPEQLQRSTSAAADGMPAVSAWLQQGSYAVDHHTSTTPATASSIPPTSATATATAGLAYPAYTEAAPTAASGTAAAPAAGTSTRPAAGTASAHDSPITNAGCQQPWLLATAIDLANCEFSGAAIYWLGEFDRQRGKFDLDGAVGPLPLDLGNVFYAPTCFNDAANGRHIVWGFVKELREVPPAPCLSDKYSYAGCVSLPRALYLEPGGRLFQVPLPELTSLRHGPCCRYHTRQLLAPGMLLPVAEVTGVHLELKLTIRRGTATAMGLWLGTWRQDGEGAALLSFDWSTQQLEVQLDPAALQPHTKMAEYASPAPTQTLQQTPSSSQFSTTDMSLANSSSSSSEPDHELAAAVDPPAAVQATVAAAGPSGADNDLASGRVAAAAAATDPAADMVVVMVDAEPAGAAAQESQGRPFDPYAASKAQPDSRFAHFRTHTSWAGGQLSMGPEDDLQLHIFLDGSVLEVFTGSGQTLTTRVYRGHPPPGSTDAGLRLFATGGTAVLLDLEAYELGSCWREHQDVPLDGVLHK